MALCMHEMEETGCAFCKPRRKYDWHAMYPGDSGDEHAVVRGATLTADSESPQIGPGFPAQFEGDCAGCAAAIAVGDQIHWDSQLSGYACAGCAPDHEPAALRKI